MTHTKGPWRFKETSARNPVVYTPNGEHCKTPHDDTGGKIAEVFGWGNKSHEQQNANARLIAAAPDLLEDLEAAVSYLEDNSRSERRRQACLASFRAAIAKARGQ